MLLKFDTLMNKLSSFIKENYLTVLSISSLILFYLLNDFYVYKFLRENLSFSHIDSYLIDQFLLFIIFVVFFFIFFLQKKINISPKSLLIFSAVLILYFIFIFFFQSEILDRYFAKDDYLQLFGYLNAPDGIDQSFYSKGGFYYYQFSFFTLLFKFFKYQAYYYNLFGMFFMSTLAAVLFVFLKYLAKIHNFILNIYTYIIIFLFGCLLLSSPTIMDMYLFMENTVAFGFIYTFFLITIFLYFIFLLNPKQKSYFFLSYLLMLYLLISAFVRTGFLPLTFIFLETLFFKKDKKYLSNFILRLFLLLAAFIIRAKVYFIPNSTGRFYGFSIYDFIHFDKIYITFSGLITTFLPYQIWAPVIIFIRKVFLKDLNKISEGFFINNLLFLAGIFFCIFSCCLLLVLIKKKYSVKILTFFLFNALLSMAFFMFFGNTALSIRNGSYDLPYISYGDVPGSRYFLAPFLFFLIFFFVLISTALTKKYSEIKIFLLSVFLLTSFVISNIQFTQNLNSNINKAAMIPVKTYTENVLNVVPDNPEPKVIYSIRTVKPITFWTYDGFATLYAKSIPKYIDHPEDLKPYLQKNKIKQENFYAFYFNEENLEFKDKSQDYRQKYSDLLN